VCAAGHCRVLFWPPSGALKVKLQSSRDRQFPIASSPFGRDANKPLLLTISTRSSVSVLPLADPYRVVVAYPANHTFQLPPSPVPRARVDQAFRLWPRDAGVSRIVFDLHQVRPRSPILRARMPQRSRRGWCFELGIIPSAPISSSCSSPKACLNSSPPFPKPPALP